MPASSTPDDQWVGAARPETPYMLPGMAAANSSTATAVSTVRG
ncbi:hypothetical protein OG949_39990 [Streptomyces scopuliridis]|nr:hypothetical protein [Streptomyces scopuliridis]WSB38385.1 hypothetical protein OG949_39990 [Streptomyces scopuliridis]